MYLPVYDRVVTARGCGLHTATSVSERYSIRKDYGRHRRGLLLDICTLLVQMYSTFAVYKMLVTL